MPAMWPLLSVGLLWALARSSGTPLDQEHCSSGDKAGSSKALHSDGHFWSQRGRDRFSGSYSEVLAPSNLSVNPAWIWKNEDDVEVRCTPLIDGARNIYIQAGLQVLKYTKDGELVWKWESHGQKDGKHNTCAALHKTFVLVLSKYHGSPNETGDFASYHSTLHALDMESGSSVWRKKMDRWIALDTASLYVEADIAVFGVRSKPPKVFQGERADSGHDSVLAVNLTTQDELWTYSIEPDVVWNFMPSSVGDGSIAFASPCGTVYRINLYTGAHIWRAGTEVGVENAPYCGTAGGVVGPEGVFYSAYNSVEKSGNGSVSHGRLAAYHVSNGSMIWDKAVGPKRPQAGNPLHRTFEDLGSWQYPAVGYIDDALVVVLGIGGITAMPQFVPYTWVPLFLKRAITRMYLNSGFFRDYIVGAPQMPNEVVAFDASSGGVLWRYAMPVWNHYGARDDELNVKRRWWRSHGDPDGPDWICLPDNQGIPVIAGDGTVYASDSHAGGLYAINDRNRDGLIVDSEVSIFETGIEFLNSPSIAPGMLVAAPCWGDVYIFRDF